MHPALRGQEAGGPAPLDDEGGREDPGLLPRAALVDLELEAAGLATTEGDRAVFTDGGKAHLRAVIAALRDAG